MSVKPVVRTVDGVMPVPMRPLYMTLLFFMALSGLGQMPIFKRYYIADLPGLGWLAQFYVTHYIHYLGAAVLLGIGAYCLARYLVTERSRLRISRYGVLQGLMMLTIVLTGMARVVKNYEGVYLSSGLIVFLNILHLVAVMVFLLVGFWGMATKKRWTIKP